MNSPQFILKLIIWISAFYPVFHLIIIGFSNEFGANPIEFLNRYLGYWALSFLIVALSITPLYIFTRWALIMKVRRLVGLVAFFYAVLHVSFYVGIDQFFKWGLIFEDVLKRKYITFGLLAFFLLVPLAATSNKLMIKFLGARRWVLLHKCAYLSAIFACAHFLMMRKGFDLEPICYIIILGFLYLVRLVNYKMSLR